MKRFSEKVMLKLQVFRDSVNWISRNTTRTFEYDELFATMISSYLVEKKSLMSRLCTWRIGKMGRSTSLRKKSIRLRTVQDFFDINNTVRKIIQDSEEGTVFCRCGKKVWRIDSRTRMKTTKLQLQKVAKSSTHSDNFVFSKKVLRDQRNGTSLRWSYILGVWCPTSPEDAECNGSLTQSSKRFYSEERIVRWEKNDTHKNQIFINGHRKEN